MPNNPTLKPLEDVCTRINNLQVTLAQLDTELTSFENITAQIEQVSTLFPSNITNGLNIFYEGLQEVDSMIQELDKITLEKLDEILTGASKGVEQLIAPIPGILKDIEAIAALFPKIQALLESLVNPSEGVEATIKPLNIKLASWSNTTPQNSSKDVGTGVLNAIWSEMNRAINDNIILKHKYDKEINSLVSQVNNMAKILSPPVSILLTDGGNLDNQLVGVNKFLTKYYAALSSVSDLSQKVDKVVVLLDKFKPDVDLVYGIVQPLGWFIELVESKKCQSEEEIPIDITNLENRLNYYADGTATPQSKFKVFEQSIYAFFENNNIGKKIEEAVQGFLPINDLKKAADILLSDLQELNQDKSVSSLLGTFESIKNEISNVDKTLDTLSTAAKRATGTVTFTRTHPTKQVTLVKGTRVSTNDNIIFVTTQDAVFNAGEFNSIKVEAKAQSVGTPGNIAENTITNFIDTPVKQEDGSYKSKPNPVYNDSFSIFESSAFNGGTDLSMDQIQGEANELAKKMLPALMQFI